MKNKKISKDTLIAFFIMVVFLYLIPGVLYIFNQSISLKFLAIIFVFIQLILSDNFLEKYNILSCPNQKKYNKPRIDDFRILTTNMAISFSILQLMINHITSLSEWVNNYVTHEFPTPIPSIISQPYFSKFMLFLVIYVISYLLTFILEFIEEKIADFMKRQNFL